MEGDESNRIGLLGFDERSETWFVEADDSGRFPLDRQSLAGLVQTYNTIHTGNRLRLEEEKTLRQLQENNERLRRTIRDLYLQIDGERRKHLVRRIAQICGGLRRRSDIR